MKSFKQQILESQKMIVYHGDNFDTKSINHKWMMHDDSNNEVGVGIYFGTNIGIAQWYGNHIVSTEIDLRNFKEGMDDIGRAISKKEAINILRYLHQKDKDFWYIFSDYTGAAEYDDVDEYHFEEFWDMTSTGEARNWQIEIAQASNVKDFVYAWNKYTKVHGLYNMDQGFISIINTKYKLKKVQ